MTLIETDHLMKVGKRGVFNCLTKEKSFGDNNLLFGDRKLVHFGS